MNWKGKVEALRMAKATAATEGTMRQKASSESEVGLSLCVIGRLTELEECLQRGVCRGENACRGRGEKFEEPWATRRCWRERREGKSFEYLVFFWTVCGARLSNSSFPLRTATFVMAPTVAFVMAPTVAFFSLRGRKGVCVSGE
ncbi:uncharacterized protein LOC124842201 isoform X2 [Vigna umbellata]|uniref:uncharacterized protein LOC124842201 isoform X2 n=1 Tax=Vigna umbellata TaxID=87088 RepID=UPI001F5EB755|nr:uncharacterized protein LOC124842201 isoform X2 [Vigna umbellata]